MKRTDIPAITSTNFDQAQQWTRKYDLSQYRTGEYLRGLAELPPQGTLPTDHSLARFIDEKRTKSSARIVMPKLIRSGLASELHETSLGFAYKITDRGEIAYQEMKQLERNYYASWEAHVEPTPADQTAGYAKLYREIRAHKESIEALKLALATKDQLIESLTRENARLIAEGSRMRYSENEVDTDGVVPYPQF